MTVAKKILGTAVGEDESKLYVDDVFSAYTYTGNGSTQTINNGIDLAGEGGLVWTKVRNVNSSGIITGGHDLRDSVRGFGNCLSSNNTTGNSAIGTMTPASNGYSCSGWPLLNGNTADFVSWTFRKAPKFFDVVTYTKPALTNDTTFTTTITNPGMVIIKRTSSGTYDELNEWAVWHRSLGDSRYLALSTTDSAYLIDRVSVSGTSITHKGIISESAQFVAYIFAHDPSADGIIQCGSFTTGSIGTVTDVNLGWEPQFLLWRAPNDADSWRIIDSMRGFSETSYSSLQPNTSNAEIQFNFTNINRGISPTATGFKGTAGQSFGANQTIIYLAIRRQNKPPTSGTQVYNAIAYTGDGVSGRSITGAGFAPDTGIIKSRSSGSAQWNWLDRLRGAKQRLSSNDTSAESNDGGSPDFLMDGFKVDTTSFGYNTSSLTFINHFFRRAPGFFDVACYTGTGSSASTVCYHSLGVIPELIFIKSRTTDAAWVAAVRTGTSTGLKGHVSSGSFNLVSNYNIYASAKIFAPHWFDPSNGGNTLTNGTGYVAYLFASIPGISKVGSYLGNGGSLVVDCGFTTGARFILIKRTDSTGDWYIWDTARGIIAANDPHLSLNTTAAEVTTDDSVDPYTAGFIVNQNTATNVNVNDGQYIFLAIA